MLGTTNFRGFKISRFDEGCPYAVIETNNGVELCDEDWQAYELELKKIYREAEACNKRFSLLFNITISSLAMSDLHRMGSLMKSLRDKTQVSVLATAIMIKNPIVRNLLTTVFNTIYKPIRPQKLISTVDEGTEFFQSVAHKEASAYVHAVTFTTLSALQTTR